MNTPFHPAPIPWGYFPVECLIYLLGMGTMCFPVFVIGIIISAVWPRKGPRTLARRIDRLLLFLAVFLFVGSFFNGLWSCLIWGRLYDSTDYCIGFVPFWPINQSMIDAPWANNERGRLLGVSLFQLQIVWFVFAASTWTATVGLYRWISRRLQFVSIPNSLPNPTDPV